MIPVEGKADLFRDPTSGAIINKDRSNAKIVREASLKRKLDAARINKLEDDVSEIKDMLKTLLNNKKK
jgi:hypothetical protein